jgi:hypothetical protein
MGNPLVRPPIGIDAPFRDPSAIMGRVSGFWTSRTDRGKPLVRATVGIIAAFQGVAGL